MRGESFRNTTFKTVVKKTKSRFSPDGNLKVPILFWRLFFSLRKHNNITKENT